MARILLFFLLLLSTNAFANAKRDDAKLFKLIKKKKLTKRKAKKLAKRQGSHSLIYAKKCAPKLAKLGKKFGFSKKDMLRSAYFIENNLSRKSTPSRAKFFSERQTGLPCAIEYDPETQSHFILTTHKKSYLGEGAKKTVRKALMYDRKKPKLVARSEEIVVANRELKLTKLLQGGKGIFKTYAFCRTKRNGKKYSAIYSKIYKPGSLQAAMEGKHPLSLHEKIKIAYDISLGLETLHKNGIVHRDLGARNYLVDIPKGKAHKRDVAASIADFGRTDFAKKVNKDTRVQGNTTYYAPEALFQDKLKTEDYFPCDMYAVGCVLYRLIYNKKAPWQDKSYVKETDTPLQLRYNELVHRIRDATEARRNQLFNKELSAPLNTQEQFELLTLRLLQINPQVRPNAEALRVSLHNILKKEAAKG